MRIATNQSIAGYSAFQVRKFVRRYRFTSFSTRAAEAALMLSTEAAANFLSTLADLGLIGKLSEREGNQIFQLTSSGQAFANATAAKPIYRKTAERVLMQFLERVHEVNATPDFLIFKGSKGLSRNTVRGYADALRAFFRYAEQRGWCKVGIAQGIISSRRYVHEGVPEGPQWKQVQQLLKSVKGSSPAALRARAVLLLLTVYGLRSGEISRLRLSDFDWRLETFTVSRSKRGGAQKYPLQREVGEAILEYIQKVRPRTCCRNLFLTLNRAQNRPVVPDAGSARPRRGATAARPPLQRPRAA